MTITIILGAIFGMDVGGSLTKIVYFEANTSPTSHYSHDPHHHTSTANNTNTPIRRSQSLEKLSAPDYQAALQKLYAYMNDTQSYGETGKRDDSLSFYSNVLGGKLHFLCFETRRMKSKSSYSILTVCTVHYIEKKTKKMNLSFLSSFIALSSLCLLQFIFLLSFLSSFDGLFVTFLVSN